MEILKFEDIGHGYYSIEFSQCTACITIEVVFKLAGEKTITTTLMSVCDADDDETREFDAEVISALMERANSPITKSIFVDARSE